MIITNFPNHPTPMFVSQPMPAVSSKMVKETVYMPSSVAARLLGDAARLAKMEQKTDARVGAGVAN